jgi:DNA polymerase-2
VLTGWNVVDFDLRLLERRARACGATLDLGRAPGPLRLRPLRGESGGLEALVEGRVVLDGIRLLRASFVRMEEYSLDFVAREVLGEGKTLAGPERWAEILDAFRNDRERFVEYNRRDARLALEILERLGLLPLAVERSRLTGVTLERVGGAIASFDSLYLAELHRRRLAAPSVGAAPLESGWASPGGHVLEPRPGLHHNVLVFDFRSLYPSLIRTFQIDPAGFLPDPRPQDDPILAPNGAAFRRGPGILPAILDELVPRREAALRAGDKIRAHAIKILMNSCYGVLGTPACRFFRPELAGAITGFGRDVLLWSKAWLEGRGYGVLYGDTDSLFVLAGTGDEGEALERGRCLAAELNRDLAAHVRGTWRVESRLELQLDRLYARLHLPPMRHGAGGARKRYVGLTGGGGEARVVFTGLEAVRRDWTEAARRVQRGLYERLFRDEEVAGYLRGVVAELRAGRLDELLVYRKALRKPLAAYTATTPPHVAAARKLGGPARGLVAYLMTLAGPEPAAARRSPIDYEHYVQKQLRAVAEPVLELLGLEFDSVVGDATQLRLF